MRNRLLQVRRHPTLGLISVFAQGAVTAALAIRFAVAPILLGIMLVWTLIMGFTHWFEDLRKSNRRNIFVRAIDGNAAKPPKAPAYVLELLLDPKKADAVIGDLEERFPKMCAKYGIARARRWFRWQVTRSSMVFLWERMRVLRWTSLLGIAEEAIRRRHF